MRADMLAPRGRSVELALAEGRFEDARVLAEELRRTFPEDPFPWYLLATIHRASAHLEAESAAWDEYMRRSETPVEACPDVGLAYEQRGESDQALDRFRRCADLEPNEPDRLTDLAGALERVGQIGEARDTYQRAVALEPRDLWVAGKLRELEARSMPSVDETDR